MRLPNLTPTTLNWLIDVHRGKVPNMNQIPERHHKALRRPGQELIERRAGGNGRPRATLLGRYVIAGARAGEAMEGMGS